MRGVDVVLSYPENYRRDVDHLGSIPIQTASGAFIPLSDLAEIRHDMGPVSIEHENVRRKAVLSCNVEGVDLRTAVNRIRVEMDKVIGGAPGVYYEMGGQFESETQASRIILWLSLLVFVIIFFLLYLAFDSFKASAIVLLNLPLALVGGIGGILLMGGNLDVASMVGLIALFGIAVRNGVLLVFRYQQLQATGLSRLEAVRAGSVERLTPVMMTAITAALALIPLIIAMGKPGNEIQSPMAVVIFCGLVTSTALNMVVLPVMSVKYGIERRSHLLKAE
jgi:Cu/Ag efflux pump CusA